MAGLITLASGFHERFRWSVGSCITDVGASGVCAGGTLGFGASVMGATLERDVGRDTSVFITVVSWVLRGGGVVRWVWCITL